METRPARRGRRGSPPGNRYQLEISCETPLFAYQWSLERVNRHYGAAVNVPRIYLSRRYTTRPQPAEGNHRDEVRVRKGTGVHGMYPWRTIVAENAEPQFDGRDAHPGKLPGPCPRRICQCLPNYLPTKRFPEPERKGKASAQQVGPRTNPKWVSIHIASGTRKNLPTCHSTLLRTYPIRRVRDLSGQSPIPRSFSFF